VYKLVNRLFFVLAPSVLVEKGLSLTHTNNTPPSSQAEGVLVINWFS